MFNIKISAFCIHSVILVTFTTRRYFTLKSITDLAFVNETVCVFCEIELKFKYYSRNFKWHAKELHIE